MKLFQFWAADQRHSNWLIHREKPEGPGFQPEPRYQSFICGKCGKFSHDDVFKEGFDDGIQFQVRGDVFDTDDGFTCVNERFLHATQFNGAPGLALKPIGKTGWHVVNITCRLDVTPDVYVTVRPPCEKCGRRREVIGSVQHIGQLRSLPTTETFFSTATDWECTGLTDRNLFATGAIVDALKNNNIKGGVFHLLHKPEEYAQLQCAWQRGEKLKLPKAAKVVL